ncbi:YadA-like family protein [Escherichia coli]|nr:adhesin [Escherichia coli]EIA9529146.1 YadA-like family protein [Escherichia coli]EIA9566475.1 YadA-like family protein [Escherichia coli]EIW7413851.1 YadA-like family protein [Escherichia coli]EJH6874136.1 YadA-like family protein [Escherichia coli]
MNKIFKVIWNPATGSYSVASETAKSRGKKSGRSKLLISVLVASGLLSSFGALANNYDGQPTDYGDGSAGDGWVAIGKGAKANTFMNTSGASTALGYDAIAEGEYSSAIGSKTLATGGASMAFGVSARAMGDRSVALGASSVANGDRSMAFGRYAKTNGYTSLAIGDSSLADGEKTIALGNTAKAYEIMSIALGDHANASKEYSMALGASSAASAANAIAVGRNSAAAGVDSLAFGRLSAANAANAIAMGAESKAAENATAVGTNAEANGLNSIALGSGSIADVDNTIALGNQSQAVAAGAIAIGQGNKADGANAIALGNGSITGGVNAIALGQGSYAGLENGTAIGAQASAQGKNSVALGAGSVATDADTVSVGNTTAQRQIVNMAAGDISTTSTDAINGSQLYAISKSVADNLGGGATVNAQGVVTSPNYRLKSGIFGTVGDALTGLDNNTLQWDSLKKAYSAAHGTDTTSTITNVKDGAISDTSKDAVNGSQLKTTNDNVATNTTNITTNTNSINTLTDSVGDLKDDALLWNGTAFSAAHGTEATSKITNVKDGDLTAGSTDAVNGSQLYDTSKYIADTLGGDAEVNADGTITAPTYAIAGGSYSNVGDALEAIDTTLDDALLWDATANDGNGAFSAAHGKDKTASVITNVANGAISATSSDAINGSQLYTTNKYIADALGGDAEVNADGSITAPTYTIANAEYNNVGDALDALDDNALLWDATANDGAGAYNASHDGKASIITNVADGNIGEGSTDAINGSQLFNTNMMIQQNSEIINQLAGNTSETYIEDNGAGINYVRTNDNGLAFNDASASGIGATAVGYNSVAEGDSSVAIGQGSYSDVDTGIALGSSSVSSRVIVKGSRDTSVSEEGVVIGYDTTDGELLGALSIGDDGKYRQIINVADGSEAHDAVTVRQLQNAIGAVATTPTKYFHANSTAEDSLAVGEDSLAMGAKTIVNGNAGIGIGLNTLVLADAINGIAIGSNARANHANSIAMGNGSQTTRGAQTGYTAYNMDAPQNSVGEFSVGSEDGQRQITNVAAGSADTDAVNVGQLKVTDAQVSQNTQSITNLNTQVTNLDTRVTNIENGIGDIVSTGSTKYFKTNTDGVDANAQGKDSVAIGSGSIAAADNSVALGTGSVANEENTISVGSSTNQRRITNVAAGKNATDAVNVAQLKSSEAGGVRYDTKADGSVDYSNITLGGGNGGTTRISNVSAGVNNNDAVNYAQLKQSVQETKQYTDQRMVEMDNKLSKTESKLSGGIASAMAMTGLPQAYTPGASMASIGGGTYNGESAVALGVSMVSANGRWVYKLQGSTNSQGEYSAALGAGIQW